MQINANGWHIEQINGDFWKATRLSDGAWTTSWGLCDLIVRISAVDRQASQA